MTATSRRSNWFVRVLGLAGVVLTLAAGAAFGRPEEEGVDPDTATRERPAIDLAAPDTVQTATFGLG